MKNAHRIEKLLEFASQDPSDPFPKYALAIEFLTINKEKSRELFDTLLRTHQEYLPTYYHAANFYAELGERTLAASTFEQGIALAKSQQDTHALRELQSAYQNFQFEE